MALIDISMPIYEGMHVWPGDPSLSIVLAKALAAGDACNLTSMSLSVHTGTHVDAPLHFIEGGSMVDAFPLDSLVGPCRVVDVGECDRIGRAEVERVDVRCGERILFRTRNSSRLGEPAFLTDYVGVGLDAAAVLGVIGPSVTGIDYLSIGPHDDENAAVHRHLLGAGIIVIEGLDLSQVDPGEYELICAPLLLRGREGAPARVFLRRLRRQEITA